MWRRDATFLLPIQSTFGFQVLALGLKPKAQDLPHGVLGKKIDDSQPNIALGVLVAGSGPDLI